VKINEKDKPKGAGDKYRVINMIIVHTLSRRRMWQKCLIQKIHENDSCSQNSNISYTPSSSTKVASGHSITQSKATCDDDHIRAETSVLRDMTGIPGPVQQPVAK
jgi:hypothetical protein